ncbi:M56 family metallopeptidase [Bacteroides sp. GD17]|jgi:hypothetical protein|uniref:M56 family metallopeptidase n=1 Tax=Bacteroides sp. GD17 TaxID=3139826 RepID=UPI0025D5D747|nr:M56 family metallopeptidase [uncultured Bacteroides sp.]
MGSLLFYIFESTLCLAILYFLFRMFFKADTLFRTNRFILLGGTLCCMILPFMQFGIAENRLWQQPVSVVRNALIVENGLDAAINRSGEGASKDIIAVETSGDKELNVTDAYSAQSVSPFSWSVALGVLYIIGAGSTLLFFLLSTWRMWRLICHHPKYSCGKYKLLIYPEKILSFSWGNTIVLSQEDYDKYADEILLHEQMHLHYRHTLDLLWMEILLVLHWFNPAAWLLMRDLRELHEFEADNGVLTHGIDATQYQLLLVKKSVGTRLYSMANGFNHSKLKNRINMMLKKRTNSWARLKLLLFVPVAAGTLIAFAQPEVKKTVEQVVKPERVKQDSIPQDGLESLKQYFGQKYEAALKDEDTAKKVLITQHVFFVNMRNAMMLDDNHIQNVEDLRAAFAKQLKADYQMAKKEGKVPWTILTVRYDSGATPQTLQTYLTTIKEVYHRLHQEISAELGGVDEVRLDKTLPVMVYFAEPVKYIPRPSSKDPLPMRFFLSYGDGSHAKVLSDITLENLEKELVAYKASAGDEPIVASWGVTGGGVRVKTLDEVKQLFHKTLGTDLGM